MAARHQTGHCSDCGEREWATATGGVTCLNCDPPEAR